MTTLVPERTAVSTSARRATGSKITMLEVLEADEGVARNLEVVVDEGDDEREDERVNRQREDEQHRRRDQQPLEVAVAPFRESRQRGGAPADFISLVTAISAKAPTPHPTLVLKGRQGAPAARLFTEAGASRRLPSFDPVSRV